MVSRGKDILVVLALAALPILFYWKLAFSGGILVDYDLFTYFYPYRDYAAFRLHQGELPLWNPYLFTGAPFLANIQAAVFYPLNLATLWLEAPFAIAFSILFHIWLAGTGMYLFSRVALCLPRFAAFAAASTFMFGGFLSAQVGHINQLSASAWVPFIFLLFDLAYRRRSAAFLALGGVAVSLQLLAGHPQESFITLFALGGFALYRGLTPLSVSGAGALSLQEAIGYLRIPGGPLGWAVIGYSSFLVLGGGLAGLQLLPTWELAQHSIRAGGLNFGGASSFSLLPSELLRALLPTFRDYPYSEYIGYVGFFALGLMLLGAVGRPQHRDASFFLMTLLLSLLLAMGKYGPIFPWFYDRVPGFDLFRVPARWLLLYSFAAAALAGMGMRALVHGTLTEMPSSVSSRWQDILRSLLVLVTFLVAIFGLALIPQHLPSSPISQLWLLLAAASLWWVLVVPLWVHRRVAAQALLLLLLGELFFAGGGLPAQHPVPAQAYSSLRPALSQLLLDSDVFRVLSMARPELEPGDLAELRAIFQRSIPTEDVEAFISATKYKEILSPNLSLTFRLPSIDGYDGGILPLEKFNYVRKALQRARPAAPFAPRVDPDQPDALLRDQLGEVPDLGLLGALNVKYLILDKLHDVWMDGVYYDLVLPRRVEPKASLVLSELPSFQATALGLVTYVEDGAHLPDGTPVAQVTLLGEAGETTARVLRAGRDTAEGAYLVEEGPMAHVQARIAAPWKDNPGAFAYHTLVPFGTAFYPSRIEITSLLDRGSFVVRGASLIDGRTMASESLFLDPNLALVHSGDVKVYENRLWRPRAYIVHRSRKAEIEEEPWSLLRELPEMVVFAPSGSGGQSEGVAVGKEEPANQGLATLAQQGSHELSEEVRLLRYAPEEVMVKARLTAPGYLVLSDASYPGWRAWVDGQERGIQEANGALRAVALEEGEHQVEFRYRPLSWVSGLTLSALSLLVAVMLMLSPIIGGVLRRS